VKDSIYYPQVKLLIRCLPEVAKEACFALKGGTAINLFVRDLPRLSVDIDLVYLPIESREESLKNIEAALKRISNGIRKSIKGSKVNESKSAASTSIEKLFVSLNGAQIVIEPNPVIRGIVHPGTQMDLVKSAEDLFGLTASIHVVSQPDLYGGKIVAALDRQHPRDLFDVKLLMEDEGLSKKIREVFVIYLASHSRPASEVIQPTLHDMKTTFENEFSGMTRIPFPYNDFLSTRTTLIRSLNEGLSTKEKSFLISLQEGNPQWNLLTAPDIQKLPALQWKLQNVKKMAPKKRELAASALKSKLGL